MFLYMFHCGYHSKNHIYEIHENFFIVAKDKAEATEKIKERIKIEEASKDVNIHVDSMIKLESVGGYKIVPQRITKEDELNWEQIPGEITD